MNINPILRFAVVLCAATGAAIVVTSQPGVGKTQVNAWPTHSMMPVRAVMNPSINMQEFKDAATLHLNDIQKALMDGSLGKFPPQRYVVIETIWRSLLDTKIYKSDPIPGLAVKGGGGHQITPAELAILYYTFDQGIDIIGKSGSASSAKAEVTPTGITAHVTTKDMGMTADQLKQMVAQYIEGNPMRFWNQARVGLASGK
ncbi:MAG: hypothetical protein WCG75_04755 [Armatimonadota bacterium]